MHDLTNIRSNRRYFWLQVALGTGMALGLILPEKAHAQLGTLLDGYRPPAGQLGTLLAPPPPNLPRPVFPRTQPYYNDPPQLLQPYGPEILQAPYAGPSRRWQEDD
jgi:hypothetical protein